MHVLAISGSTRDGSHNAQLLRAAAAALPPGVELVELDPALIKAIPAFDEDDEARAGGDDIPALLELRKILQTIGAKVVDRELVLAQAHQQFDDRGSLLASDLREQLVEHIEELLDAASAVCA